jgi:psiF repeat
MGLPPGRGYLEVPGSSLSAPPANVSYPATEPLTGTPQTGAATAAQVSAGQAAASCTAQAKDKHLSGAAQTSFMKKCETDAKAACEASAKEMKLSGAAAKSHITKCVNDAVGK